MQCSTPAMVMIWLIMSEGLLILFSLLVAEAMTGCTIHGAARI